MHDVHDRPARGIITAAFAALFFALATLAPPATAQDATRPQTTTEAKTITVFAAASLKNVLDEAAKTFTTGTGTRVTAAYAASSALARQFENGAPADLFISADQEWMDHLAGKGLIAKDTRVDLVGNRLVLIAPAGSPTALGLEPGVDLAAALGDGRLAVADVKAVPAGKYARAALEHLGAWSGVADRLAQAENVRAALALVAQAEAPLGIVYATDAKAEPKVRVVAVFPASSHPPIVYPGAVVASSPDVGGAKTFLDFLSSREAAAIFAAHGFTAPN